MRDEFNSRNTRVYNKAKYSQGYIPKVQYWAGKLMNAKTALDQINALNKVRYFQKRHYEVYGVWPEMKVK